MFKFEFFFVYPVRLLKVGVESPGEEERVASLEGDCAALEAGQVGTFCIYFFKKMRETAFLTHPKFRIRTCPPRSLDQVENLRGLVPRHHDFNPVQAVLDHAAGDVDP